MSKKQIKPSKKEGKEDDDSTQRLSYGYRKRCDLYGLVVLPVIKQQLEAALQINRLQMLHCNTQVGPMQMRALMQVAADLSYAHLRRIRIWKGAIGDEGVRYVCQYLCSSYSLELIDFLDNGITALGCQFIGKAMRSPLCRVLQLKLDNNLILNQGLRHLAEGLRLNNVLDKFSLKYCGIDHNGTKYIQEILANIGTRLRSLKLEGNQIGNEGVYQVLRAVDCCESLSKINLADTGMNLLSYKADGETIVQLLAHQLMNMISKNKLMIKYDMRFNELHNDVAVQILKGVQGNLTIKNITFPMSVNYDLRQALDMLMRKRNKVKGKGKKKASSPSKGGKSKR